MVLKRPFGEGDGDGYQQPKRKIPTSRCESVFNNFMIITLPLLLQVCSEFGYLILFIYSFVQNVITSHELEFKLAPLIRKWVSY